jgi:hypothetical protein
MNPRGETPDTHIAYPLKRRGEAEVPADPAIQTTGCGRGRVRLGKTEGAHLRWREIQPQPRTDDERKTPEALTKVIGGIHNKDPIAFFSRGRIAGDPLRTLQGEGEPE